MASLPASYPNLPYLGAISGGLHHGLMIRITGEMLHHDRFNVDIKTGPVLTPSDDINLHLSVRPNENAIVRNHMVHQTFGPEERYGGCPINFGQQFEILILAEVEQFKIAINGRHFCEFRHRIPLSTARFIHVHGAVKIHYIKMEGDPHTMIPPSVPTAPPAPPLATMTTSVPSYQPPSYPYQPMQTQYIQPSPYGNMSSSVNAVPSNQPSYPSGGGYYYPPQQTYYYPPEQNLSSQPYQQYPSYHAYHVTHQTQPYKSEPYKSSSAGSTALKYGAAIGGIGLGAYALSKVFDSDHSDSD